MNRSQSPCHSPESETARERDSTSEIVGQTRGRHAALTRAATDVLNLVVDVPLVAAAVAPVAAEHEPLLADVNRVRAQRGGCHCCRGCKPRCPHYHAGPGDPPTALVHPLSYSASHTRVSLGAVNARVCGAATHWQGQLRRAHTYWLFTHDGTLTNE